MDLSEFLAGTDGEGVWLRHFGMSEAAQLYLDIAPEDPQTAEPKALARICFSGVREYSLSFQPGEYLSHIFVSAESALLWDYGPWLAVYGNAPLPDPHRFFSEFYQLVRFELQLSWDPSSYLKWGHGFSEWLGHVYTRSYLMLRAPAPLAEAALPLLDVQAAEYTVLPEPKNEKSAEARARIAVSINRSWIICSSAEVNLLGPT
jgi:hypothetical protein